LPNYICKHQLGVCFRSGKFTFPDTSKSILIGRKRKPGRPKNTKARLQFQDDEQIPEYIESDTEDEDNHQVEKLTNRKKRKIVEITPEDDEPEYDLFFEPQAQAQQQLQLHQVISDPPSKRTRKTAKPASPKTTKPASNSKSANKSKAASQPKTKKK
jgi:hypothetical protein